MSINLKWNRHEHYASRIMSNLRKDHGSYDVTLVAAKADRHHQDIGAHVSDESTEDSVLGAHSFILKECSAKMKKILDRLGYHTKPCIYFYGVNAEILSLILDFIYLGQVSIGNEEEYKSFVKVAKDFEILGSGTPNSLVVNNVQKKRDSSIAQSPVIDVEETVFTKIMDEANRHDGPCKETSKDGDGIEVLEAPAGPISKKTPIKGTRFKLKIKPFKIPLRMIPKKNQRNATKKIIAFKENAERVSNDLFYPCPITDCGQIFQTKRNRVCHFQRIHINENWQEWADICKACPRKEFAVGSKAIFELDENSNVYRLQKTHKALNFSTYLKDLRQAKNSDPRCKVFFPCPIQSCGQIMANQHALKNKHFLKLHKDQSWNDWLPQIKRYQRKDHTEGPVAFYIYDTANDTYQLKKERRTHNFHFYNSIQYPTLSCVSEVRNAENMSNILTDSTSVGEDKEFEVYKKICKSVMAG